MKRGVVTTRSREKGNEEQLAEGIPGARRLTKVTDNRDVCFTYRFTHDEKRIIYLRETKQGSEFYHLYSLDISASTPVACGKDMLADYPHLTCSVGFVGGLQLWLPPSQPDRVILSTGKGSLLWDLSSLNLESGELKMEFLNPMNSKIGLIQLVIKLILHIVIASLSWFVRIITLSIIQIPVASIAPAPAAPLQYFVDKDCSIIGCASCSVSLNGIAMRFLQFIDKSNWEIIGKDIPLGDLNMQLVGSGAATGTLRFDRMTNGSVAIHTCQPDIADTTAYVEYPGGRILANDETADINSFISNPVTGEVEAVIVIRDHQKLIPLNESGKRLHDILQRVAHHLGRCSPSDTLTVSSRAMDDSVWILRVSSDAKPAEYHLVHSPNDALLSPKLLVTSRPNLSAYCLSDASPVTIPTRDGELLPGYLTLPRTGPQNGLPLVLLIHGGPSARDYPGYDPVIQLFASRGISVLTVNYRGSAGYGMTFLRKGNGSMQEMHNDVEDARLWTIQNRIADPRKVAIVGGSWGGYLALGGATSLAAPLSKSCSSPALDHHPYAAVVAIVPPVTVGKANTSSAFRGDPLVARYWRQIYGSNVADNIDDAKKLSPLYHLKKLQGSSLLLVHGEDDPRVPREHGDQVAAAALDLKLPGAFITYSKEGHSIRREANVLHMWHMVELFLCQCLELQRPPELDYGLMSSHTGTVHWSSIANIKQ